MWIVGEAWLLDGHGKHPAYYEIMRRILRAQILTARQRNHVLVLNTKHIRKQICSSAERHIVSGVAVPCIACGWAARLSDWVRAVDLTENQRLDMLLRMDSPARCHDGHFLEMCQPQQHSMDTLSLVSDEIPEV